MSEAIPRGLCQCGCGQRTNLARWDYPAKGHVKGEPYLFVAGHKAPPPAPVEEDHGFTTPCLIWQGRIDTTTGYGRVTVEGRDVIASRHVYEAAHGELPAWPAVHVDHKCRVVACVRLDHLEAVTAAENVRRGTSSKLTDEQTDEILTLCGQGWVQSDIARAYGVGKQHITSIKLGRRRSAMGGAVCAAA